MDISVISLQIARWRKALIFKEMLIMHALIKKVKNYEQKPNDIQLSSRNQLYSPIDGPKGYVTHKVFFCEPFIEWK